MPFPFRRPAARWAPPERAPSLRAALLLAGSLLLVVALLPLAGALGFLGPRTYLVVSLNPTELRPHGGFVGAYASLAIRYGRVALLAYGDSQDLDHVYAERVAGGEIEDPVEVYPALTHAGHSPDFPTSARSLAEVYRLITDVPSDGVVALDPAAAGGLLRLVGPLQITGEDEPVTASNLLGIVLQHTQNFESEDEGGRKQFVFDLGQELASRLRALPPTRWPEVIAAVARAADERHIQLYFEAPLLQRVVHALGWDGAYPPPADDFLAVVDSNWRLGNKANLVTDQALDYRVEIGADGATTAELTISYENRGTDHLSFSTLDMPFVHQATYDADVRVYVPHGSRRLSRGTPGGGQDPGPELGRTVFQERAVVKPESRQSLTIAYLLPNRRVEPDNIRYRLFVRKQAGTAAVPLRVGVVGPAGWRASGGEGREWTAQTTLAVDRQFSVLFERSSG